MKTKILLAIPILSVLLIIAAPGCPRVCSDNGDCDVVTYCAVAAYNCEATGICVPKPEACAKVYDPVCSCGGLTYNNACLAAMAGVNVAYQGECDTFSCKRNDDCDLPGMPPGYFCAKVPSNCNGGGDCDPTPENCYEIYAPVCGCDGLTYDNDCSAAGTGINIAYFGPCDL